MAEPAFVRVRLMVETTERTFRGNLHLPASEPRVRLTDYLNRYDRAFLILTDVNINERGQTHRPSEKREFVAIATTAITFVTTLTDREPPS